MVAQPPSPQEVGFARRRLVLLGASNVTRGLPTVVRTARRHCGERLQIWIAAGHGRSYGMKSTVFGRTLPGIAECDIWNALAREPALPTSALVTDIGNDLLYDASVERIIGWISQCLDRLQQLQANTVMTLLPLVNLQRLTPQRFLVLRSLLFPACRLSWQTIYERAHALDQALRDLGNERRLCLVQPRGDWYGLDPIHVRYRHADRAWRTMLAAWREGEESLVEACSWGAWWRIKRLQPALRWVRGKELRQAQPALRMRDGTSIALY